jgi:hypothetical protein
LEHIYIPKPPGKKGTSTYKEWAKEWFLELLKHGYNYSQAAERLGYTYRWWAKLRKEDPEWEAMAVAITSGEITLWEYPDLSRMSFADFVERYAGFTLAEHQKWIATALEDPLAKVVLVLGHPESGKSTLISLWYVLYRLAQNPDARIAIVTKNSTKAQDLLTRVKRYLTEDHLYDDAPGNLITEFGGWKPTHGDLEWSQNQIFTRHRKSGERDPSIQALGIGKQIYGSRLDLLVMDDALVMDNQISETTKERLDNWFDGEARSRAQKGQTVVNGTRLLPGDLYGQWKKAWQGQRLFRQVIIPAIQDEFTDDERVTWPGYWTLDGYDQIEHIEGEDHIVGFQMGMRDIRDLISRKDPNRWKLIYQQEDVELDQAIFRQAHIDAALELGAHRRLGQVFDHERLVLGVDPATTGRAAAVLLAVDPTTHIRTVIDIYVGQNLGATGVRQELMYQFWERYRDHGIAATVIEENFVKTLRGDESLQARAQAAGTHLAWPHTLGKGRTGKWDQEYGIAAMASLFGGGLMAFANAGTDDQRRLDPLIDDLMVFPWSEQQDAVIALWVANGMAHSVQGQAPDQAAVFRRRGVPDVVRRGR